MKGAGTVGTHSKGFRIGFRFLTLAVVLASAEPVHGNCEKAGQRPEIVGEYRLVSANGQTLPAVVSENGSTRQEVVGWAIPGGCFGFVMLRQNPVRDSWPGFARR